MTALHPYTAKQLAALDALATAAAAYRTALVGPYSSDAAEAELARACSRLSDHDTFAEWIEACEPTPRVRYVNADVALRV